jgi:hypothetical protein
MPRVEHSIEVRATPERVFETSLAVDKIASYGDWNPTFVRGIRVIDQTDGVGTTWEFPLEALGATARSEMVAYEPPHLVRSVAGGGVFAEIQSEHRVEPAGEGSRLIHVVTYRLRYAPLSFFVDAALVRGKVRARVRATLVAMKERAEFIDRLAA